MKNIYLTILFASLAFTACETAEDRLDEIDHIVPDVEFKSDSLIVNAGEQITVEAVVSDAAGLQRLEFSYGDWLINQIIDLKEDSYPDSYNFSLQINIPGDAMTSWEEEKYFKDGSSTTISQEYHQLFLNVWDVNRNYYKGILYVKVNP